MLHKIHLLNAKQFGQSVRNRSLNQKFLMYFFSTSSFCCKTEASIEKCIQVTLLRYILLVLVFLAFLVITGSIFVWVNIQTTVSIYSNYLLLVEHLRTPLDRKELLTGERQNSAQVDFLLKDTNLLSWTPCPFRRQFLIYLKSISTLVHLTWWHLLKTDFCFFANSANKIWFLKL